MVSELRVNFRFAVGEPFSLKEVETEFFRRVAAFSRSPKI